MPHTIFPNHIIAIFVKPKNGNMEQLKIAIADKILEASAADTELMRTKLRKIQRFSDFSEALKSMMQKYPEIEEELLRMVNDDDFDTAKASRRVDYILNKEHSPEKPPILLPETPPSGEIIPTVVPLETVEVVETPLIDDEIDFERTETVEELPEISDDEYFRDEAVTPPEIADETNEDNEVVYTSLGDENSQEWEDAERKKKIISLVLKILAVVAVLLIAYFIITNYWRYILITLAIAAAVYGGWRFYMYQKTKRE